MNDLQSQHITEIIESFKREAFAKYEKGTIEHDGNLWTVPTLELIQEAMNEAVDQYVYLYTLREQLRQNRNSDVGTNPEA